MALQLTASQLIARNGSRLLPLLASSSQRSFHVAAFRRAAAGADGSIHSESGLPGSAKSAMNSAPGSVVGGHAGVIAPSQAMTEEWGVQREYPDYSKGPSALDKASKLFFFTEILRGMWVV